MNKIESNILTAGLIITIITAIVIYVSSIPSKQDKRIDAFIALSKAPDSYEKRSALMVIAISTVQNAQSPELCGVAFQLNVPEDSLRKNCK